MLNQIIYDLVGLALSHHYIDPRDQIYIQNQALNLFKASSYTKPSKHLFQEFSEVLEAAISYAVDTHIIEASQSAQDIFGVKVMNLITPLPSQVNDWFWKHYQDHPIKATDFFYQLSQDVDYIKTKSIARNYAFQYESSYGPLEITINLSKPEKDPKDIARASLETKVDYPESPLSLSNEGYAGRRNYPARSNHRVIRLQVEKEDWGFQYSPYAYFQEHCIFFSQEIRPMKISETSLRRLLELVRVLPHYFVGSNADLPIVGGSILSHDHFQGGRHTFPMERAPIQHPLSLAHFDGEAGIVEWPLSTIRLRHHSIEALVRTAMMIFQHWQNYSDETVDIIAYTGQTPHNTITPIARFKNGRYELDIVLRNNRTSSSYPDGIFHPHSDLHHIKKENIGLIEVMGLAILPPRLKKELDAVKHYLLGEITTVPTIHADWAEQIKVNHTISADNIQSILEQEVGKVFERVLEDAGVFKQSQEGQEAFLRFLSQLEN